MRVGIFLSVLVLGCFLLCIPGSGAATQQAEHQGQVIEYSDDPADCTVCHDGQLAPENTHHPILSYYPPWGREDMFAPADSLKAYGARLFSGKVACVSCHNLKNTDRFHLVTDNGQSRLCFMCHRT